MACDYWQASRRFGVFAHTDQAFAAVHDDSARIWDLDEPNGLTRLLVELRHESAVNSIDFSPDADFVLTVK